MNPYPDAPHQARWQEPLIFELSQSGRRGIAIPTEPMAESDAALSYVPASVRRQHPPQLPEVSQPEVVKHFIRLSQETLGVDVTSDVGVGTCTMKYSPKIADRLVYDRSVADLHPLQDASTVQGALEILHSFEKILCELSGMARFSFQPGGGTQAIFTNACIIRAYHLSRGDTRDEIITTVFSHPGNAAAASTAGFKVITLYPEKNGLPSLTALRAAVSERTAGFMVTNPEDTGLFNPEIDKYTACVHEAGGLCAYDQANANGLLGVVRAREAGFDLCQFNLHKTFGSPHGAAGLATGAAGATERLERFLPLPVVMQRDSGFVLDYDRPESIGKVRAFYGVLPTVIRSYTWVRALGAEGLREVAETAVLNNNYLAARLREVRGLSMPYRRNPPRLEQVRYSWRELLEETGIGTLDVARRVTDFGMATYFASHHPWVVPEPMTLEPVETTTREALDRYAEVLARIAEEAYADPATVRNAPHQSTIHRIDQEPLDDPERWVPSWRAWRRRSAEAAAAVPVDPVL